MKLQVGNMFDHLEECNVLLVTTNQYIKKDGSLVMGAGAALQLKQLCPGVDYHFGHFGFIKDYPVDYFFKKWDNVKPYLGYFNVKDHFKDKASLERIKISTNALLEMATDEVGRNLTIFLNYPGIGNGKLKREDVEPIISVLPDNVHVWIKK